MGPIIIEIKDSLCEFYIKHNRGLQIAKNINPTWSADKNSFHSTRSYYLR